MTTDTRPQMTWSRLTPIPVTAYHPQSDSHIAYWNGIGMVRASALLIVNGAWGLSHATPKMRRAAYDEFRRAYKLGAFGDVRWGWDDSPQGYSAGLVRWICKADARFLQDLAQQYTVQEALGWFRAELETAIDD